MILPYKLDTTNDLLTSRAGLLATIQLMDSLNLAERIDQHFPLPKNNRRYKPSEFIQTFILMQHEGSFHLDDIRHLQEDETRRTVLGLKTLPQATTLGDWVTSRKPRMLGCRSIKPCYSRPYTVAKK